MVQAKPKYFFAAFGDTWAGQHPVDGGIYPHKKGHIKSKNMKPGDVVLLYCVDGYVGHNQESPGIGMVIDTQIGQEKETIFYQYFPFDNPIDWNTIKANISELQKPGNTIFYWAGNWLREISSMSFKKTVKGRTIDWP
jgi:hypothetical protein